MGQKSTRHATAILSRELNGDKSRTLYIAFHKSDPGPDGNQSTNEISYPGYKRSAFICDGTQWTVKDGKATNAVDFRWPLAQDRGHTATFFSIGTDLEGPGEMLRRGRLTFPAKGLEIVPGMIPVAPAGKLTISES